MAQQNNFRLMQFGTIHKINKLRASSKAKTGKNDFGLLKTG